MHPVEFLYWLMGAIKLGNLCPLQINSPSFVIVFEHIELVKQRHTLQLEIGEDRNFKDIENEKDLYQMVLYLEAELKASNQGLKDLELIAYKISDAVKGYYYERKNQMLYYLQGAFELTDLDQIKITRELIFNFSSDYRLRNELLFFFKLTGSELIDGLPLDNLKAQVDRALWTAC
jgi:hypothetical protein